MRKFFVCLLAALLLLSACGPAAEPDAPAGTPGPETAEPEDVGLTLWTYPVGGLGSGSTVSSLLSSFQRAYPHIHITLRTVDYQTGDQEVEEAIGRGEAPDLIFEGPERLLANWGARGLMADLSDLWQSETAGEIYGSVAAACVNGSGAHYIYPLCMTTHCMAINRDLFEAAGAWQYIDEETHTWSTEDFIAAVAALRAYGIETVGIVYCGGQGGDQGTRALVTNLYSGSFTDEAHTRYAFNSPENVRALELLAGMEGIRFAPDMVGTDEIDAFCRGETAMCFCWNVANEVTQVINNPNMDFDIFPMTFPTDDGDFSLQGGIWGFGVFDNGDEAKIEAAKTFIRFMTEDTTQYTQAVLASSFWPVRDVPNIYENDDLMTEYFMFRQYMGDYYQVTPGWAQARTAWWTMLQQIGAGGSVPEAAAAFESAANAAG